MENKIPFDLFGEKQELSFSITDVGVLERRMGKTIYEIRNKTYAGVDFCLIALPIALNKQDDYEEQITKYLLGANGRSIDDIAAPLVHALFATGVYGKEELDRIMELYYPELYKKNDNKIKNA